MKSGNAPASRSKSTAKCKTRGVIPSPTALCADGGEEAAVCFCGLRRILSRSMCKFLEAEILQCRRCETILATKCVDDPIHGGERVEPRPIVPPFRRQPILLVGQAPGGTEYTTRQPFRGRAGMGIRKILAEVGITDDKFDQMIYSTAIVKCFPGSKHVNDRREDEKPSPQMVRNCIPYLEKQIGLYHPRVMITLGSFPLLQYLTLRSRSNSRQAKLEEFVGTSEKWDDMVVIFLPHTSGASTWLNKPSNKALFENAKSLLRRSLVEQHIL